jgi:hypothetical protein
MKIEFFFGYLEHFKYTVGMRYKLKVCLPTKKGIFGSVNLKFKTGTRIRIVNLTGR